MREALAKQRDRRVKAASERAGLREGLYRVKEGEGYRWCRVWVDFYPTEHWMVEDVTGPLKPEKIEGTRRRLDDDLRGRLENWI